MSQLHDIEMAQKDLEELFMSKMDELQSLLQTTSTAKDTVAKVADEFRTFRELVFNMFSLLRSQISECTKTIDCIETQQRQKCLVFFGVAEKEKENCSQIILDTLQNKAKFKGISADSIKVSHRLGSHNNAKTRPILVRFSTVDIKSSVWRAKTMFKGTPVSVREFLTKTRQQAFSKARLHFGMRDCWTQDGVIVIKTSDGQRHRIISMVELDHLMQKFSKASEGVNTNTINSRKNQ